MQAILPETSLKNKPVSKELLKNLTLGAIIVLVGVAAFGLGRLSALSEARGALIIHDAPTTQQNP